MSTLYTKDLLRLATSIPYQENFPGKGVEYSQTSRVCGSRIRATVAIEDGVITDYAQQVKACALGQAAAAIVGGHVMGLGRPEYVEIHSLFDRMVAGEDIIFPEKWKQLQWLKPVSAYPGRQGSVRLPFLILQQAFADQSD